LISLDGGAAAIIKVAQRLRSAGVSCELALKENLNVGKQLKLADNANARYALFIGGDEARDGKARVKNLADGKEVLIGEGEIEEFFKVK
jgi:histidyl-tRNA synthetase